MRTDYSVAKPNSGIDTQPRKSAHYLGVRCLLLVGTVLMPAIGSSKSSAEERKIVERGGLVAEHGAFRYTEKNRDEHPNLANAPFWKTVGEELHFVGGYAQRGCWLISRKSAVGDCEYRVTLSYGAVQTGPFIQIPNWGYFDLQGNKGVRIHSSKMPEGFEDGSYPCPRNIADGKPVTLSIKRVGDVASFYVDDHQVAERPLPSGEPIQFALMPHISNPRVSSIVLSAGKFVEPIEKKYTTQYPACTVYESSAKPSQERGLAFRYRIPALVVSKKNTVFAFAEARRDSGRDDCDIDIVLRRSSDNGQNWGPEIKVVDQGRCTSGNPCPVVLDSGRILLLTCRNPHGAGEGGRTVFITHSDDDGLTWSEPRDITEQTKHPSWHWYATGPGAGIQLTRGKYKGRVIVPCDCSVGNNYYSHIIYSDDNGENWRIGAVSPVGLNECEAVELSNGDVMVNSRNHRHAAKFRGVSVSHDGGETFDPKLFRRDEQLPEPHCQASIRRYSWPEGGEPGVILFANPGTQKGRVRMTLRASYDDGETWPYSAVVYKGPSAYCDLTILPNGAIGLLFEKDGYQTIEFVTIPTPLEQPQSSR